MYFWLETVKWYHSAGSLSRYGWNQWHYAEDCCVIYYGFLTEMTRFNQGNGFTCVYVHVHLSLKRSSETAAVMMNDLLVSVQLCVIGRVCDEFTDGLFSWLLVHVFFWSNSSAWMLLENNYHENLLKMYSPSGHPRCRWVVSLSDLEKCSITSLAYQWILCSEWVPSEWESKHNPQVIHTTPVH